MVTVHNPILKGFYPDPSICRVDDTYYIVTSTFAYFPGVPIFASKDLAHWEQIGSVLDREEQLPLANARHSQGIFAPSIRYHNGVYYMITTNVSYGGNFIVTATDPSGPWSNPYYLGQSAPGIDPSLFFDEDGSCYYVGTRPNPEGVRYNGDWEIWVQPFDVVSMKFLGEPKFIWKGALRQAIWPEGPHIYKKDGYYYVMNAEGGTGPNHAITIARSKEIYGPYENNPNNPIITHRHLGKKYPVQYVGHGDLVETPDGDWYMIMLASRPSEGYTNIGRETYLAKVTWEDGWPVVNDGIGIIEATFTLDHDPVYTQPLPTTYHFHQETLHKSLVRLRNPKEECYSLTERAGWLRMYAAEHTLKDIASPSYVGVRQQHYHCQAETMFELHASSKDDVAGLAIVQSNEYHIRMEVTEEEENAYVQVVRCNGLEDTVLTKQSLPKGQYQLKLVIHGQKGAFYYVSEGTVVEVISGVGLSSLSTEIAGGFVGCTIGIYSTSNGQRSDGYADFAWLSYSEIEE